jgi:hypothetical protein
MVYQTLADADTEVYGGQYHCQWPIFIAYGQVP